MLILSASAVVVEEVISRTRTVPDARIRTNTF